MEIFHADSTRRAKFSFVELGKISWQKQRLWKENQAVFLNQEWDVSYHLRNVKPTFCPSFDQTNRTFILILNNNENWQGLHDGMMKKNLPSDFHTIKFISRVSIVLNMVYDKFPIQTSKNIVVTLSWNFKQFLSRNAWFRFFLFERASIHILELWNWVLKINIRKNK